MHSQNCEHIGNDPKVTMKEIEKNPVLGLDMESHIKSNGNPKLTLSK